ncbi:unnamed protein product [Alternaria alternata]
MARQLHRDDYTVGWVCALPVELAAAQEMLDEEHPDLEHDAADNDENLYSLGSIGGHNVAIVCLPAGRIGNNPAAVLATQLRASFKAIRFGLMVGIGGGVPSAEADIRLGDVVVSQPHQTFGGVVQYDSGKTTPSGFARTGSLNSPPQILLSAVAKVRAKELRGRSQLSTYVSKLEHIAKFQRAKMGPDVLFEAGYDHEGGPTCDKCKADKQDSRQPRGIEEEVVVHYGTIASGNQVMRSAAERDRVSAELGGVLCFEMEAAGLMNSFPCLVVRGVCDYADSHKNKRWQPYAAGAAAAYAKEVLSVIPPSMVEAERKIGEVLSDLYKVAEDFKSIAGDGLAISQKAFDIQRKEHDQKLSDQQARCLQLFRLTQSSEGATYEWYKERIAGRVEGTCLWFLNHPHFQEWRRSESGPLLVSADPGCGKSVLAKYLIDHVLAELSTVCYFFFKDQVQNTVREALCALLHQLFSQKRSLLVHAMEQYDKDGARLVNSTSSLWSVFREAVQDANAGPVTIVLDALDECAESETRDLLQHIESQVRSSSSRNAKLKLLMTSRPYEHIVSELHSLSEAFPRIRIPGEDESETISQEVNCVVRHRVDQFAKERKLSDEIKRCLEDQLLKMEHRTYLWAYLVFDYLQDFHFKRTPKGIASTFDALPKSVHQAYEQILSKSKDRRMVQKVLAIILAATRPLTLAEMSVAMEVDEKTKSIDDIDLEQEHDFKSRLRSWCGLFVSVYHGKIYFLHQTAREFLLAKRMSSNTIQKELIWNGFTTMKNTHTVLAECCVRFLSFFDDGDSLTTDQEQGVENCAFLKYSAMFWDQHVRESNICDDESAAVAPLTFKLCDSSAQVYRTWSKIHVRIKYWLVTRSPTRLMLGCYLGQVAVVKRSLEKGADITFQDGIYGNALHVASGEGYEQVVKLLLDKGADINAKGKTYGNALHVAVRNDHEQIAKLLLDRGADVNALGGEYGHAIQAASENGNEQMMRLLLDKGADAEASGGTGYGNPLWVASESGDEQIVKLLLDKGADVNAHVEYNNPLCAASESGHEQIVKLLLDKGADVNAHVEYEGPLYAASKSGHEQVVKLLLDTGKVNVNANTIDGWTPLLQAACNGDEVVAKLLLDTGEVDIHETTTHGWTPLLLAVRSGQTAVVKLLLDTGKIDVNETTTDGWTPLLQAAQNGHEAVVKLLLDTNRIDVDMKTTDGSTPLLWAAQSGHEAVVKQLLDTNKVDVNAATSTGSTPLSWAAQKGYKAIVKLLLDTNRVDVNMKTMDGSTPLLWAAQSGHEAVVKLLLDTNKVDVNAATYTESWTPLFCATWNGHEAVVKLLQTHESPFATSLY